MRLPYSRVVNVTLTRNNQFPDRRGFGIPLLLSNVAVADVLDADNRTKVYGSLEEVAADHAAGTEVYKAATAAFSQNPRPTQIKVGYVAVADPATAVAADLAAQMDLLYDRDGAWYWVDVVAPLRDRAALDGLVDWIEANNKILYVTSNDVRMLDPDDTLSIAARHKNTVERTAVFYHDDVNEYPSFAHAAYLGTFNFDDANSNYTAKFKQLRGVSPVNLGSAAVQAITGFTPQLGQSTEAGHMANTLVDIGGRHFVVEGSTLTANTFIDEVHASDWIVARTEEETLGVLLNNRAIPYTDQGMEVLASGARTVMEIANRAGLIANDLDENGDYSPAITFDVPSVFSVPESQRKARIAPAIAVTFRYAGAVHYTTINYRMTF